MAVNSLLRVNEETGQEEILCPNCGHWQPRQNFTEFTLVPRFMALLTPVFQCTREIEQGRICRHIFAVTEEALRMRQRLLEGVEK